MFGWLDAIRAWWETGAAGATVGAVVDDFVGPPEEYPNPYPWPAPTEPMGPPKPASTPWVLYAVGAFVAYQVLKGKR